MFLDKLSVISMILIVFTIILVSCTPSETPTPETVVRTVIVEKEIEKVIKTTNTPRSNTENSTSKCCGNYRIAIFEEPVSLNYWSYLGGPGSTIWTQYIISNHAAHLFELSDKRFQFVPSLAKAIPESVENEDGTWSITVEMFEDATWSDGVPITAHDVVFTHKVCNDLELTFIWPIYCATDDKKITVEAVDDYRVKFDFLDQAPKLSSWEMGIALAPVLPKHYWADIFENAYSSIEGQNQPVIDDPARCQASDLSESEIADCEAWNAYETARRILYEADATDQPVAGVYAFPMGARYLNRI